MDLITAIQTLSEEELHLLKKILAKVAETSTSEISQHDKNSVYNAISEHIFNLGIPCHISGYEHIRTALMIMIYERDFFESKLGRNITSLYQEIAERYKKMFPDRYVTKSSVERNIRHAIEKTYGTTCTNSQFLFSVADELKRKFYPL